MFFTPASTLMRHRSRGVNVVIEVEVSGVNVL